MEDLYSLIRTSRLFHDACSNTKAGLRPRFAKKYGQSLSPPHPHLLIAGTARSVADWAVRNDDNRGQLIEALKGGIEGPYNLVVEVGRISLQEARDILKAKYGVLNPLTRIIDLEAGPAAREIRYAEDGDTLEDYGLEWWTMLEYSELTLLHHWIYCELFHHTFTQVYDPASLKYEPLSRDTRWTHLSYCVTDCNNKWVKVAGDIVDQAVSYAHSPFMGSVQCFMLIQQILYTKSAEDGGDFNIERIAENLDGKDKTTTLDVREHLFYNIILHQSLLSLQLLLNEHEFVNHCIEEIRRKVLEISDHDIVKEDPDQNDNLNTYDPRWLSIYTDCYNLIWEHHP